MGTRVKFATWLKIGRVWYVKPPNWPKECELSFSSQDLLKQWANDNGFMLKDGNPPRRDRAYGRYA